MFIHHFWTNWTQIDEWLFTVSCFVCWQYTDFQNKISRPLQILKWTNPFLFNMRQLNYNMTSWLFQDQSWSFWPRKSPEIICIVSITLQSSILALINIILKFYCILLSFFLSQRWSIILYVIFKLGITLFMKMKLI